MCTLQPYSSIEVLQRTQTRWNVPDLAKFHRHKQRSRSPDRNLPDRLSRAFWFLAAAILPSMLFLHLVYHISYIIQKPMNQSNGWADVQCVIREEHGAWKLKRFLHSDCIEIKCLENSWRRPWRFKHTHNCLWISANIIENMNKHVISFHKNCIYFAFEMKIGMSSFCRPISSFIVIIKISVSEDLF